MLKKILAVLFFVITISNAQSKEEKIITLLDLMGTDKSVEVMKEQFLQIIKKASPTAPTDLLDTAFKRLNIESLYKLTIPVYDKNLDEKTIDGLIKFYKTDVGKTLVEKMPIILQESMQIGAAWGQQIMQEILLEIQKKGYEVQGI